jgi:hypothetical protein
MGQILLEDKTPYGFVYKITNIVNNKCYIGQTVKSVSRRFIEHKTKSNPCHKLARAIKKYGKRNFVVETLCECFSFEELNKKEVEFIEKYNSIKQGYNIRFGGVKGRWNKSSIKKMTKSQIKRMEGKYPTVLQYDLQGNLVREWRSTRQITNELGLKISDCLNGRRYSRANSVWVRKGNESLVPELIKKAQPKPKRKLGEPNENRSKN